MTPSQIARMISEDIHVNNGLLIEYKLMRDLIPLLKLYPGELNFGFDPNDPDVSKTPEFVEFWKSIADELRKMYNMEITDNVPSRDFSLLITSYDPTLLARTDDKLVALLRGRPRAGVPSREKRAGGLPGSRTAAIFDKPTGAGRTELQKRRESKRLGRLD